MISAAAENLSFLFEIVWGPTNPPQSEGAVASSVQRGTSAHPGVPIKETDLRRFREGDTAALTELQLTAIAAHFGVPSNYFRDEVTASRVNSELNLLARLRQAGVSSFELESLLAQLPSSPAMQSPDALVNTIIELHKRKPQDRMDT